MLILTDQELQQLTGRQRRPAQLRALKWMGIEHRVRPDGSIAVLREHVQNVMGVTQQQSQGTTHEPDWSALT
jgi:hypothetical protein